MSRAVLSGVILALGVAWTPHAAQAQLISMFNGNTECDGCCRGNPCGRAGGYPSPVGYTPGLISMFNGNVECDGCCRGNPCGASGVYPPPVGTTPGTQSSYAAPACTSPVQTAYRTESYTETVPVTAYRNVVVDQGSYQKVWVPKLVTKRVPYTAYQQRLRTRIVPTQASCSTPAATAGAWPATGTARPDLSTNPYYPSDTASAAGTGSAYGSYSAPSPATSTTPVSAAPTPAPGYGNHRSTRFRRSASAVELERRIDPASGDTRSANSRCTSPDSNGRTESSRASGRFVPAPSAAMVWQTQR